MAYTPFVHSPGLAPAPKPPVKAPAKAPVKTPAAKAAPAPASQPAPTLTSLLAGALQGPHLPAPPDFTSPAFTQQVETETANQVNPEIQALQYQQAHQKFLYDQEAEQAKGWYSALANIFGGGNTGQAAMDSSLKNFGGSYLGAEAASLGTQLLGKVTQDFNNNDWQIASQLSDVMSKIPAVREKVKADLMSAANGTYNQEYRSAQDEYGNRIKLAGLLLNAQSKSDASAQAWARIKQGDQRIAQTKQNQAFNQTYKINSFNATQAYRQTQIDLKRQGLIVQQNKLQQTINKGYLPSASLSKLYGHIVDANGDTIAGPDGKPIPVKSTSGAKPLDAKTIGKLNGDAARIASNALNGFTDKNGKSHPPLNFGNTLQEMRKGSGDGQIPLPIALSQMKQAGWTIPAKYKKLLGGGSNAPLGGSTDSSAPASFSPTSAQTQPIKAYAFTSAANRYGWGDSANLAALDALWTGESNWSPYAVNKSSGAAGIPQALGHGHVFNLGDYKSQIDWGLNYIKQRYGSPAAAYRFWLNNNPHWY